MKSSVSVLFGIGPRLSYPPWHAGRVKSEIRNERWMREWERAGDFEVAGGKVQSRKPSGKTKLHSTRTRQAGGAVRKSGSKLPQSKRFARFEYAAASRREGARNPNNCAVNCAGRVGDDVGNQQFAKSGQRYAEIIADKYGASADWRLLANRSGRARVPRAREILEPAPKAFGANPNCDMRERFIGRLNAGWEGVAPAATRLDGEAWASYGGLVKTHSCTGSRPVPRGPQGGRRTKAESAAWERSRPIEPAPDNAGEGNTGFPRVSFESFHQVRRITEGTL